MKIKITVTKEILEKSKDCCMLLPETTDEQILHLRKHCAVSEAVREIFPICDTFQYSIVLPQKAIYLPLEARKFIKQFDNSNSDERVHMPECSFEIDVPESVISEIGIEEVHRILATSKTISIVEK